MLEGILPALKRVITPSFLVVLGFLCLLVFILPVNVFAQENPVQPTVPQSCTGEQCKDLVRGFLYDIILQFGGGMVSLSGKLFDTLLQYFVLDFGKIYIETGIGFAIEGTWTTVRDVFNIFFIFGLVYIGFQIILGVNDSQAKRTIPLLILAALLVNFSLFIVKLVIDFANIIAVALYSLFQSIHREETEAAMQGGVSITNAFINALGMSELLNSIPEGGYYLYLLGLFILFLVLAYVFIAGAILLAIRFAVLCMLMIFSPVMFLGWVFPGFEKYSREFFHKLFAQAFFAPLLIFLLYLSYMVTDAFNPSTVTNGLRGSVGATDGTIPNVVGSMAASLPYFVMVVVFLLASMHIARSMGVVGADTALKLGDKARKWGQGVAGGATLGLAARAGRGTIGAAAYAATQNDTFKRAAAKSIFGRAAYAGAAKVADSSFDARNVGGVGKAVGIGAGRKGGFTTALKEQKERDEKFLKGLGTRSADEYDVGKGADYKKDELDQISQMLANPQLSATRRTELLAQQKEILAVRKGAARLKEELTDKEVALDNEQDINKRFQLQTEINEIKKDYDIAKKRWAARDEYLYQSTFMESQEKWKKAHAMASATAVGIGASILAAPFAPLAAAAGLGVAAGAVGGKAVYYNNKKRVSAVKEEYGANGLKKRGKAAEDKSMKKALEALTAKDTKKENESDSAKKEDKNDDDH